MNKGLMVLVSVLTVSAYANEWVNYLRCDNHIQISYRYSKVTEGLVYKLESPGLNNQLNPTQNRLMLNHTSVSQPEVLDLSFPIYNTNESVRLASVDNANAFKIQRVTQPSVKCLKVECVEGCYAGDTPVWACTKEVVVPEVVLYEEELACQRD